MRQIDLLNQARMQLADPAHGLPFQDQACASPRMQGRMRGRLAAQLSSACPQQGLDVFLDVIEVDLARRYAPLFFQSGTPGGAGQTLRLRHPRDRKLAVAHRGVAVEDPAQLEYTHPGLLAVGIMTDVV